MTRGLSRHVTLIALACTAGCHWWNWDRFAPDVVAHDATVDAGTDATLDAGLPVDHADADAAAEVSLAQASCPSADAAGCGVARVAAPADGFSMGEATSTGVSGPPYPYVRLSTGLVVDRFEVTVGRWRQFEAAGRPPPSAPVRYPGGQTLAASGDAGVASPIVAGDAGTEGCVWQPSPGGAGCDLEPVDCVGFDSAVAFCAWDAPGGRLPTEAEWEWVARFASPPPPPDGGREFPWGNDAPLARVDGGFECTYAQWDQCEHADTCPAALTRDVGSFPSGALNGIADLAGNVFELTADAFQPYANGVGCWGAAPATDPLCQVGATPSVRGGSWSSFTSGELRTTFRAAFDASDPTWLTQTGFRCVRSDPP